MNVRTADGLLFMFTYVRLRRNVGPRTPSNCPPPDEIQAMKRLDCREQRQQHQQVRHSTPLV